MCEKEKGAEAWKDKENEAKTEEKALFRSEVHSIAPFGGHTKGLEGVWVVQPQGAWEARCL